MMPVMTSRVAVWWVLVVAGFSRATAFLPTAPQFPQSWHTRAVEPTLSLSRLYAESSSGSGDSVALPPIPIKGGPKTGPGGAGGTGGTGGVGRKSFKKGTGAAINARISGIFKGDPRTYPSEVAALLSAHRGELNHNTHT
jgi:hypothetical protein